ncbi:MAG TPA: VWA domain-containing protein [Bryobacteraceae bacterium]|nr:VWA domain-containing protein [Bryobacteraceae bacterium]
MTPFKAEVFQNAYLPQGAREVNAIMTVTADGMQGVGGASSEKLIGIICDNSGSMDGGKIHAAKDAMMRMIWMLPVDASFFIIAGAEEGELVVPTVRATTENKQSAVAAVRKIRAVGGTCISTWLGKALAQFSAVPNSIRQAILLTDGENEKEDEAHLDAMLAACEGAFQCECRGVGADWKVAELRKISGKLLGTTDIISRPDLIEADFQEILQRTLKKDVADVMLRLWSPIGARIKFCKQVSPEIVDLTTRAKQSKPQVLDYPTGAWGGSESRDYHFCIEVNPGEVGDEMLAGRASLVCSLNGVETKVAEARILAVWTGDESKSTRIDRRVAHYTGQAELAQSIQAGLEARDRGDEEVATALLGKAVRLAHESGNEATRRLLRKVVDVEDESKGTVRLKRQVAKEDAMALETRSTKTARIQRQS